MSIMPSLISCSVYVGHVNCRSQGIAHCCNTSCNSNSSTTSNAVTLAARLQLKGLMDLNMHNIACVAVAVRCACRGRGSASSSHGG